MTYRGYSAACAPGFGDSQQVLDGYGQPGDAVGFPVDEIGEKISSPCQKPGTIFSSGSPFIHPGVFFDGMSLA